MKKYIVFAAIFLGYGMLNYNRKSLVYCIPSIIKAGFDSSVIGTLLTGHNMAYAISKFYGGILCDKAEPKLVFAIGLMLSGIAALLISQVTSSIAMVSIWFACGLAQGLGWPAVGKLLTTWFEPAELGLWWSLSSASANGVGAVGPYVATYLIKTQGWRSSMLVAGVAPCIVALVVYLIIDKKQKLPPKVEAKSTEKKKVNKTIGSIFYQPTIYVVSISYLFVSMSKTFLTDWSQVYLINELNQAPLAASAFVSNLELGGLLGGIGAGFVSDILMKRNKSTHGHPRMKLALLLSIVTALCFYLLDHHPYQVPLSIVGFSLGASIYGQIAIFGIVATQSIVPDMGSSSHAIAAMFANLGSMLAGLPLAALASQTKWSNVVNLLLLCSVAMTVFMISTIKIKYALQTKEQIDKKKK